MSMYAFVPSLVSLLPLKLRFRGVISMGDVRLDVVFVSAFIVVPRLVTMLILCVGDPGSRSR